MPFPPPGGLLNPGIEPGSPASQADSLPTEPPRSAISLTIFMSNRLFFNLDLSFVNSSSGSDWFSDGKASARNEGDLGSIPESGSSPGEGNGNPLQYSCLENPMDEGAWWATVPGVTKSGTRLSNFSFVWFSYLSV